jgi:hypothetical protein
MTALTRRTLLRATAASAALAAPAALAAVIPETVPVDPIVTMVMYALGDRGVSLDWFLRGDIRRHWSRRAFSDPAGKIVIIGARLAG